MIKKTLQKALEFSKAMTEIIKAWSEAIVSLMAAITTVYTGFKEIKKLRATDKKSDISTSGHTKHNDLTGTGITTQTSAAQDSGSYYFDSNSAVFLGTSLIFVFLLARMGFRRKSKLQEKDKS